MYWKKAKREKVGGLCHPIMFTLQVSLMTITLAGVHVVGATQSS